MRSEGERARLWVTVGLPGTGKTTRARELAARHRALRAHSGPALAPCRPLP